MALALSLHLVIIPAQVESMTEGPVALSPSLFCHITAFLLLILSFSLVVSGLRDNKPIIRDLSAIKYVVARGATAIVFAVLYILAIEPLGYFVSTIVFMAAFLWLSGVRSWKGMLLFFIAVLPFIYFLFVKALQVILPSGILI
jgi:putative tricarboxylic transport membrane protein